MASKGKYIEAGDKCKESLFLRRHRCIPMGGLGWRCKYCYKSLAELRKQERGKEE